MPQTQKFLIRTLVKSHVSDMHGFDDIVRDKGRGLVGLLAGPPGMGKTLTAEAIAEVLQRPLYALSSGDLGDNAQSIDKALTKVLELAHIWKAVLLLDEADVFLVKRAEADLVRNAIVSIFLRQLEYYQGILILTTNRFESVDEAFQSRIHFRFSYSNLSFEARKKIWKTFLERVGTNKLLDLDVPEAGIHRLALPTANGREIKNVVKMAQAIAIENGEPMMTSSIELVMEQLRDFNFERGSDGS